MRICILHKTAVLIFCFYFHRDMSLFPSMKREGTLDIEAQRFSIDFILQRDVLYKVCMYIHVQ